MKGEWIRKHRGDTTVIFVHGILSSGETAWQHDNGTYWPQLLTDEPELEALGIYVFTYQTSIFSGSYRIGDVVDALKEQLRLDRVFDCRCLVFVCHSMGGIVVRQFLVDREAELIEKGIAVGLFLIASPSLGSSYANWFSALAKFFGQVQADALRFSQDNAWLNDLDKNFLNLKEARRLKLHGKELVEDKFVILKKLWREQLVKPFSGARYFADRFKVPLSDHFSIAKPDSNQALQHRLLCKFLADLRDAASDGVQPTTGSGHNHPITRPEIRLIIDDLEKYRRREPGRNIVFGTVDLEDGTVAFGEGVLVHLTVENTALTPTEVSGLCIHIDAFDPYPIEDFEYSQVAVPSTHLEFPDTKTVEPLQLTEAEQPGSTLRIPPGRLFLGPAKTLEGAHTLHFPVVACASGRWQFRITVSSEHSAAEVSAPTLSTESVTVVKR